MKRPPKPLVAVVVLLAAAGAGWLIWRPQPQEAPTLSGYVEGDPLYLSTPVAGAVQSVVVARGDRVEAGAALFVMDARTAAAQRTEAQASVAQRRTQIGAAEAALAQARATAASAEATAANARRTAQRYEALRRAEPGALAAQELDAARAAALSRNAEAEAARRQAAAAVAQVASARAEVARAGAGLEEVGVRLDLLAPRAPLAGRIEEVFFQPGEWAGANQPVVSLLPDAKVRVRFFVPQGAVAAYRPGVEVRFGCDGCGPSRPARIVHVSARPEFTPPVIYSRQSRERLVFMVEARPLDPAALTPGLPVDVIPLGGGPP